MSNLLVRVQKVDFTGDDGSEIKGTKLHYIEKTINDETNEVEFCPLSHWIKADDTYFQNIAKELKPGQIFDFEYEIKKKKAIVVDIIPGDVAVDFDKIFEKGD